MVDRATRWGVLPEYFGYKGDRIVASTEARDAVLAALGASRQRPPRMKRCEIHDGACAPPPDRAWGWAIQLYGMVQVEPGANVLTLGVKNEEIRFVVHDVHCASQACSMSRFLSDTTHHTPGVYVKGPDTMLDTLLKEKPSTRVLKLSGLYHPDSRMFVLNGLEPFQEKSRREF